MKALAGMRLPAVGWSSVISRAVVPVPMNKWSAAMRTWPGGRDRSVLIAENILRLVVLVPGQRLRPRILASMRAAGWFQFIMPSARDNIEQVVATEWSCSVGVISLCSSFCKVSISNGTPVATTSVISDLLVVVGVMASFVWARIGP